jgi:hypothetical protein
MRAHLLPFCKVDLLADAKTAGQACAKTQRAAPNLRCEVLHIEKRRSTLVTFMPAKPSKKNREEDSMRTFETTHALGILMVVAIAAGLNSPASAAADRSGKFAPANWPEETIYRPECRIIQSDGSWLGCSPAERNWHSGGHR